MNKLFTTIALIVIMVAPCLASAATIELKWSDTSQQNKNMSLGDEAQFEIWAYMYPSRFHVLYHNNVYQPEIEQTAWQPEAPGWVFRSTSGPLGSMRNELAALAPVPGEGYYHLATQTIKLSGGSHGQIMDIAFDHDTVFIATPGQWTYDQSTAMNEYGRWGYHGFGHESAIGEIDGILREASPLTITVVPEPATLAAMGLGCVVMLRRKR